MGQNQPYNNVELICWVLHNTEVLALMIVRGALSRAAAMAAIKKSEAKSEEDVRVIYTLFHFLRKPTRICIKLFNALVLRSAHARRLHLPAAKFMDSEYQ